MMNQKARITACIVSALVAPTAYSQSDALEIHKDGFYIIDALGCYIPLPTIMVLKPDPSKYTEVFFVSNVDLLDPNYEILNGRVSITKWVDEPLGNGSVDGFEYSFQLLEERGAYSLIMGKGKLTKTEIVSFHIDNKVNRVFFSGGLFNEELVRKIFNYCLSNPS